MARLAIYGLAALLGAAIATGDTRNSIYQFNPYCEYGIHYEIDQWTKTIKIKSGFADPAKRFQFAARTEEYQGGQWVDIGPGYINLVRIHEGVGDPGTVILEISGSPPYPTGAIDVRAINLPPAQTADSHIWWIRIQGDLGIDGLSDFDRIDLIQVDGGLAVEGVFFEGLFSRRVGWGDITGAGSLAQWDYVRFGVVPEPGSGMLLCLGLVAWRNLR